MRRSKSGTVRFSMTRGASAVAVLRCALAAIVPRNDESEDDVDAAEAGAEQDIAERDEKRRDAEQHETDPHHRHHTDRERAAGNERRAVAEEPERREQGVIASAHDGD